MINTKVGLSFTVYTRTDCDPMGTPFIDDALVARSKAALRKPGWIWLSIR